MLQAVLAPHQTASCKCRVVGIVVIVTAAASTQIRCRTDLGTETSAQSAERQPVVVKDLQVALRPAPVQSVDIRLAAHF